MFVIVATQYVSIILYSYAIVIERQLHFTVLSFSKLDLSEISSEALF